MSIKNEPKIKNPLIAAIREQLEHRALWMYLLCDEAKKKGLDSTDYAPAAIKRCGLYQGANLLIAADCCAYAYGNFHNDFMKNHITIIGCPKLDVGDYTEKLTQIIKNNDIQSVKIARMSVPCCGKLEMAAKRAIQESGKFIPWGVVTITPDGEIKE